MQNFESASKRLEEILEILSGDEVSLDTSLELYAEATELIRLSSNILKNAQIKIQQIDELLDAEE